jgi:hypothetical protein
VFDSDSILAVVVRPYLWLTALGAATAFAPDGWWRRYPFLPLADPTTLRWRLTTAYGSPEGPIDADDLIAYLQWRRRQRPSGIR